RFADTDELRDRVGDLFAKHRAAGAELERARVAERDRAQREDLLRLQVSELDAARLRPGEEDELRAERRRLQHAERLSAGLAEAAGLLNDDDGSAMSRLHRAARLLRDLARLDPAFAVPAESVDGAGALVEDALAAVRSLRDSIAMTPGRLEAIDERLDALTRLKRKYGDTEAAMLAFRAEAASELERLGRHEEILAEQERVLGELDAELSGAAHELAKRRHDAAERFAGVAARELPQPGMEPARAAHHVRVSKSVRGRRTRVSAEPVTGEARVDEVARMVAGDRVTETARGHARELLGRPISRTRPV